MKFESVRMFTSDTKRLVAFYAEVAGVAPTWYTDDFAEVRLQGGTLAIAHERTLNQFAGGAVQASANRSVVIDLRVDDVDADFQRLGSRLRDVVQEPTTMPWGNRSLLFRDPDGNLVNLFTPRTTDALARAERT